ncbi:sirohydrochlorin chelatase [Spirulina major CS-329]|uniref:sirohydrochlorin chelatase n=1 Tax=Spirulina TaxID=1154 RepID=UPI00232D0268|nr:MULTISPECIES: sirohydrochlorin chelatase [Spirulina]MDB9497040.1 sirohydrochlorin chelatase [Spirulina subsalsa CS-330]MDB9504949.1 sirohydrochlorin chelatase [Spirulina major CS-329]
MSTAYLFIAHGSRDPRSQTALESLAQQVQTAWARDHDAPAWIATAVLELAPQPLHQQILTAIAQARSQGAQHLILLPLFLLPGVHVREDIPHEVALAQAMGDRPLPLTIAPYVGSHLGMTALLRRQFALYPHRERILLAHGSRRIGGNQPVEAMAQRLTAIPAYWSVQPSLPQQLQRFVTDEQTHWIIQPYFLFPGGITDAIAQQLADLRTQWPNATLDLGIALSDTPEFIPLILDWMHQPDLTPS